MENKTGKYHGNRLLLISINILAFLKRGPLPIVLKDGKTTSKKLSKSFHFKSNVFFPIILFYRGKWTKEEDLIIVSTVLKSGTKWSKMASLCKERTEHDLKNRFFSVLSKHISIPIGKVKKSIDYLNPSLLKDVIKEIEIMGKKDS